MEQAAAEKLAIAKSELLQKIIESDDMILYYIRSQAGKVLEELKTGVEDKGIVSIDIEKFELVYRFLDRLSTIGTLAYISDDIYKHLDSKENVKKILNILK